MHRMGADTKDMCEMELDDIFIVRLKLLIIMTKAFLNDYPMGTFRKKSVLENADYIKKDAVGLFEDLETFGEDDQTPGMIGFNKGFYQRVKLLAIMAEAFAKGRSLEERKQDALVRNLNTVCESITFQRSIDDIQFLQVA